MMSVTDPVSNLAALIRCPSVTPEEGGALELLVSLLRPMGFSVERPVFSEADTPDVENLYAKFGNSGPHLMFAGHTDVVPPGDDSAWTHPAFGGDVEKGMLFGRGAVDMKGAIACFIAAFARQLTSNGAPNGQVSLLITGDEEGPAINGTAKLLEWAQERGEHWDAAVVGEPTNPDALGDMIKIGRRGSLSGRVEVNGKQGHVAYPHLADNAVRGLLVLAEALLLPELDNGNDTFEASNLEITSMDVGNPAVNVVPGKASLDFNIRFNDRWSCETLMAEIHDRLDKAARRTKLRPHNSSPVDFALSWRDRPSHVFLTRDDNLMETLAASIEAVTGKRPKFSTSGGTSDARFIKDYCPVVEFGLVGKTMHMVDERVPITDLETLTKIYQRFIDDWFGQKAA